MCSFIHTLPTLWGWAFRRLRRLLRTNAYAAMHKMACFESADIVSECEKMTQGGRTVCYWYTKYPPGSLSASTVGGRRVCSQLPSHSVCGHSTIVAWCVRVIQQSSSSSLQTTIVGPTKVAWCVPSFRGIYPVNPRGNLQGRGKSCCSITSMIPHLSNMFLKENVHNQNLQNKPSTRKLYQVYGKKREHLLNDN